MDRDTLIQQLSDLGKNDFDPIALAVVKKLYGGLSAIVDGSGDGGSDIRVFSQGECTTRLAVQTTVQEAGWKKKVIDDATTAANRLKAKIFVFLTNRNRKQEDIFALEDEILRKTGMPARILGAREIAGLISDTGDLTQFIDAARYGTDFVPSKRPNREEVLLGLMSIAGSDTNELNCSIAQDVVSCVVGGRLLSEEEIKSESLGLLGDTEAHKALLSRRFTWMVQNKQLVRTSDTPPKFRLSDGRRLELGLAEQSYTANLDSLYVVINQVAGKYNITFTRTEIEEIAHDIARLFVYQQLKTLNEARISVAVVGFLKALGDPLPSLEEKVKQKGCPASQTLNLIRSVVNEVSAESLIQKLCRAAIFIALDGSGPLEKAQALGARNWKDISVLLDASVLIPFICAQRYRPTEGRFSRSSIDAINFAFINAAQVATLIGYINESAAHLLRAFKYESINGLDAEKAYSRNGFVSHYYHLRSAGESVPSSLAEYLYTFAPSLRIIGVESERSKTRAMSDLTAAFSSLGLLIQDLDRTNQNDRRDIETEYAYQLQEKKVERVPLVMKHDIDALCHLKRRIAGSGERWMFLSWDKIVLTVGNKVPGCGWVVNPSVANELAQVYRPIGDRQYRRLSYELAKATERPLEVTARIIDRIVAIGGRQIAGWQVEKDIIALSEEVLAKSANWVEVDELIRVSVDAYLNKRGIEVVEQLVLPETADPEDAR